MQFCFSKKIQRTCLLHVIRRRSLTLFSAFLLALVPSKHGDLGLRVLTRESDANFRDMLVSFLFRRICLVFFGLSFASKLTRVIDDVVLFDATLSFVDEFLDDDARSDEQFDSHSMFKCDIGTTSSLFLINVSIFFSTDSCPFRPSKENESCVKSFRLLLWNCAMCS